MRGNKILLYIAWITALNLLIIITLFGQSGNGQFSGLTKSKQTIINNGFPVKIVKIYTQTGHQVNRGDILAKVVRTDIKKEVNTITHSINQLIEKQRLYKDTLRADINLLKTKERQEYALIDSELKQVRQTFKANQQLLHSIDTGIVYNNSDHTLKLEQLTQKKRQTKKLYQTKKSALLNRIENSDAPVIEELKSLYKQKQLLKKNQSIVPLYAGHKGVVDTIGYTAGEIVKAYEPIITMRTAHPTFVEGYIHEDVKSDLKIGQKVLVKPKVKLTDEEAIYGTVVDIGTQIFNLPAHLNKFQNLQAWGYKALISLPENRLKLEQKVTIASVQKPTGGLEKKIYDLYNSFNLDATK